MRRRDGGTKCQGKGRRARASVRRHHLGKGIKGWNEGHPCRVANRKAARYARLMSRALRNEYYGTSRIVFVLFVYKETSRTLLGVLGNVCWLWVYGTVLRTGVLGAWCTGGPGAWRAGRPGSALVCWVLGVLGVLDAHWCAGCLACWASWMYTGVLGAAANDFNPSLLIALLAFTLQLPNIC